MDRRKSIKTLVVGGFTIGAVAEACKQHENPPVAPSEKDRETIVSGLNRMKEEIAFEKKIEAEPAFLPLPKSPQLPCLAISSSPGMT
ncbi:MAG TPA: hypothetical protein VII28_07900 [Puia sp.]